MSERRRMASITPLMPSPGNPKIVSTPQRCKMSNSNVEALVLMLGSAGNELESAGEGGDHALRRAHRVRIIVVAGVIDSRLFEEMFDDLIAHDHRVAPAAIAEAQVLAIHEHAHPACEMPRAIGNQAHLRDVEMATP